MGEGLDPQDARSLYRRFEEKVNRLSKSKAVRVDPLGDTPLDIPGAFIRAERRHWADGTSCLHIAKWGIQPKTGRPAPWWPLQYIQIPWELAGTLTEVLKNALLSE